MKTKFQNILGVFAVILMVASFVVPINIAAPSAVSADPGIMKWDTVATPASVGGKNDIMNDHYPVGIATSATTAVAGDPGLGKGSSINGMAVGNDGATIAFIDRTWMGTFPNAIVMANDAPKTVSTVGRSALPPGNVGAVTGEWDAAISGPGTKAGDYFSALYFSRNSGVSADITRYLSLIRTVNYPGGANLYQVAIAPDDPNVMVVTSDRGSVGGVQDIIGPTNIWITVDGGNNWELAFNGWNCTAAGVSTAGILIAGETIRCIDISADYGGKRDIAFGTVCGVNAAAAGRWFARSSSGFNTWLEQADPLTALTTAGTVNYYAIKFSPTYASDVSVALVYTNGVAGTVADVNGTFFNVALRDVNLNTTESYVYSTLPGLGVKLWNQTTASVTSYSPVDTELNNASLQLPSDFSGQSSSLRRAYVALDAYTGAAKTAQDGIYRVDDTTVYVLMDTTSTIDKSIYSIVYFGTYASGKLLAGERLGFQCTATVPTWFTDSPTTCPIPCWYPALKPTTGAANIVCAPYGKAGFGAAIVGWNADGSLGLVSTGSMPFQNADGTSAVTDWWGLTRNVPFDADESAFGLSRNNGETWNQIVLINTTIDWFNDVAVAPDCTTIYLASANRNTGTAGMCNEFDSVWRATINPNVAAPLPAVPPLGTYWERVFTHTTSLSCKDAQSDLPILRVVPSCTDKKDGEIVGWAAQTTKAMAWSPDYGDYWATMTPRYEIQDFAFESSTTLYTINAYGMVQRLPYTGTSWSTNLPTYQTNLETGHTIVAVPDGKVLAGSGSTSSYPVSYSADKGVSWETGTQDMAGHANVHVIFDVDFKNNSFIYAGDDAQTGSVYRNTAPSFQRWFDNDMMSAGNGNGNALASTYTLFVATIPPPHIAGQFGLAQAWTGTPQPALYTAHDNITYVVAAGIAAVNNSAVCRSLGPRNGIPKTGVKWSCLNIFAPLSTTGVRFTLEPASLKYCGCCTIDTNTTLYAIDDRSGNWTYSGTDVRTYSLATGLTGHFWNSTVSPAEAFSDTGVAQGGALGSAWYGYTPGDRRGMLWAYTDCLAKKGPVLKSPADKFLVGADPVTGRNQQVDLSWEQLCLSTSYELQLAKDNKFTLKINPLQTGLGAGSGASTGAIAAVSGSILVSMDDYNMTAPAMWIYPGALPEAGAIYFWRIRSARSATLQIAESPWSAANSFTVKAGFIVNTPYYGVQLLSPNNGCTGCRTKPLAFSWSPWKEATKYQFDLSKDPEFKSLVVTTTTTSSGYEYQNALEYSSNYFWRVKALEVNGQKIPSDWSATFSLTTAAVPAIPPPPAQEAPIPLWVWVLIAIGTIMVIAVLFLVFKTRRI